MMGMTGEGPKSIQVAITRVDVQLYIMFGQDIQEPSLSGTDQGFNNL